MKEVKRVIQNTHKNIAELATNSDRYKKSEIFKKKKCMGEEREEGGGESK